MANKNTLVCLFLVLFIFFAGGESRKQNNTCQETWETICVIEDDCREKCAHDHGSEAIPICNVQQGPTGGDLCVCQYDC
ncbi:hypothetical protein MKX01_028106 [Papaver californicum]|nr:hypothetical protein MKX01_028106 [Papaver californicum]